MRIIKEGKIPEPKVYRITCYHCGTVYEFTEEETMLNCADGVEYTECPVCKYFNDKPPAEVLDNENENEDKNNKSWEEYQNQSKNILISIDNNISPFPKYEEIECKCPKCGAEHIYKNVSEVLTSLPPQYYYRCKKCDWESIGH